MTIYRGIKKNIDQTGENKRLKKINDQLSEVNKISNSGVAGAPLSEPVPNFISSTNDNVIRGENNTWIVLGRDRSGDRTTGYGGLGDTQAGAIDIVVGRMGDSPADGLFVDTDFFRDSARIYISQKTDIDQNFKIAKGSVGESKGMSGIALKADAVRLISREGIKLVTGTDTKNSKGADITGVNYGIDLIANNNDSDLQPMVKGENLRLCLESLVEEVNRLSGIVSTFLATQMEFNKAAATHYHYSPFYGRPTSPSISLAIAGAKTSLKQLNDPLFGLQKYTFNMIAFRTKYLVPTKKEAPSSNDPADFNSAKSLYINSQFNKVN